MWHEDSAANRRTGILLVSLATLSFSMLDTTVKWLPTLKSWHKSKRKGGTKVPPFFNMPCHGLTQHFS